MRSQKVMMAMLVSLLIIFVALAKPAEARGQITTASVGTPPIADAGTDQLVSFNGIVRLDGSNSHDLEDTKERLKYEWTSLTIGLAITDFDKPVASFIAPNRVQTISIQLSVTDTNGNLTTDTVRVTVVESVSLSVFVSASRGLDTNPGTDQLPVKSLDMAFQLAKPTKVMQPNGYFIILTKSIYVEARTYTPAATLSLFKGMSFYGGFEVTLQGDRLIWSRTASLATRLTAPWVTQTIGRVILGYHLPITLSIGNVTGLTIVDGLTFDSSAAQVQAGENSNPVYIINSNSNLRFTNNVVIAGRGGNGALGARGINGTDGKPGLPGGDAIHLSINQPSSPGGAGGRGGTVTIDGALLTAPAGGRGGLGANVDPGYAGSQGGGSGGKGGLGGQSFNVIANSLGLSDLFLGKQGESGRQGAHGTRGGDGGNESGAIINHLWRSDSGGAGQRGASGSGGGGGGASGACPDCFTAWTGAAGGGGGGGGTPGAGGSGGQGGGGSIGMFLSNSSPTIITTRIVSGNGGIGGAGGDGGCGGLGGPGNVGGVNPEVGAASASGTWLRGGPGGWGGQGGAGGGGGGGAGGISAPIYVTEGSDPKLSFTNYQSGAGGAGGRGGQGCIGAPNGDDGRAGLILNPPDMISVIPVPDPIRPGAGINQDATIPASIGTLPIAKATFSSKYASGNIEMSLISPSGHVIGSDTSDANVEHQKSDGYEQYQISNPETGSWQVRLIGQNVRPEGEPVAVEVKASPMKLNPTANPGWDIIAEATSSAGAAVSLNGSSSSDPDGDALTHEWRDAAGRLIATAPRADLVLPLGRHQFALSVRNRIGSLSGRSLYVTVRDTTPPDLVEPAPVVVTGTVLTSDGRVAARSSDSTVTTWLASARATDTVDSAVSITHNAASQLKPGVSTVTFKAMDDSGNVSSETAYIQVIYNFTGFQSFQRLTDPARTVPVRFQLLAGTLPVPGATASIAVYSVVNGVVGSTNLIPATNNRFTYDTQRQAYVYNWATRSLQLGTYRIVMTLDDGTTRSTDIVLR